MTKKTKDEKKENGHLINATFLDKNGNKKNIKDVIGKGDCWFLNKANSWILTHNAIKTIANIAGISKNYEVEESQNIVPDYKNELEHIVRITIHCKAKRMGEGCVHSDEDYLTITGESNRTNTPNKGRGYLRKMAEKRAFDIAVLEHLNLYSSVFSEEESSEFTQTKEKEPILMPGSSEFESLVKEINFLLKCVSLTQFRTFRMKMKKGIKENKYSAKQLNYLRELYKKRVAEKAKSF